MQIKLSLGKIQFKSALPQIIEDEIKQNKIQLLPHFLIFFPLKEEVLNLE
ncbi:hypothetical protein [Sphaerospermopsis sp. FACHB-1194]|nr:hypothetical protein [Sphaerospermopsis sp. FACHB-1194]